MGNFYELLSAGNLEKVERFGSYIIKRPCLSAPWACSYKGPIDASFVREPKGRWALGKNMPKSWILEHGTVKLKLSPTDFGHLGIFPEHKEITDILSNFSLGNKKILNLFAYTGYASIFCALNKAMVTHVDASKPSLLWAKENGELNGKDLSIRFILDDAMQFLKREIRRKNVYDGIILDPPSFGRGPKGQLFKIERDFSELMSLVKSLLSKKESFVALSSHTPGYFPSTLVTMLEKAGLKNPYQSAEMLLPTLKQTKVAVGSYAVWKS